ncbi:MFS transporter, partial [Vibrio vulnificus]
ATIIGLLAIICAIFVITGTTEKDDLIRSSANRKTTIKDVARALAHNDQLLWTCLAYFMYSLANTITTGVLYYFFKFVLNRPGTYWVVGMAAMIISFLTSPLYPVLN